MIRSLLNYAINKINDDGDGDMLLRITVIIIILTIIMISVIVIYTYQKIFVAIIEHVEFYTCYMSHANEIN